MFKIQYFSLQTKRTSFQLLLCVSIECVITEELVSSLNRFESECICKMRHSYDQIMCTLYTVQCTGIGYHSKSLNRGLPFSVV